MNKVNENESPPSVKVLKFEPKVTKDLDEENSKDLEEIKQRIVEKDWETLFALGFTKDGELEYIYSNTTIYELLGQLEAVKFYFMNVQMDGEE